MVKEERGIRLVPVWLPVAIAVVTVLCNLGATSATFGSRLADSEKRLDVIERDREQRLRDYQGFQNEIRSDVAEMKTDLRWIREALRRSQGEVRP